MNSAHVVPWLTIIFFCASDFHYKPSATSEDSAAMPGSQEMSQDESGTPTTLGMAATLTTELKAWYLANNPTLHSQGLSCPKLLYKEMQRDFRYCNTKVAIIPVIDSDEIEVHHRTQSQRVFVNAKPA